MSVTKLTKPVAREVPGEAGVPFIATMTAAGLAIRLKRSRHGYLLPWGAALTRAAMLEADRTIAAKRSGRRQRVSRGLLATEARHG